MAGFLADGYKVIIFTRFRTMIQYIEDYLGVPCIQYHGQMNSRQKEAAKTLFASREGPQVFLSSYAGAYGTDMPMSNHLINYDSTVIAGRADQVNARHVRASSEFTEVYVHTMVTVGTIEERVLLQQEQKRRVASAITVGTGADYKGRVKNEVPGLAKFLEQTVGLTA